MNPRLIHDAAWRGAGHLSDMASPALTPGQLQEFRERAYLICKAMLEAFCADMEREASRLCRPSPK